jgi:hypothetical protein
VIGENRLRIGPHLDEVDERGFASFIRERKRALE